jgi:hypothetical protein
VRQHSPVVVVGPHKGANGAIVHGVLALFLVVDDGNGTATDSAADLRWR